MKVVIDIPEDRYADIQRIASVQLERRYPTPEQIIAKGVIINELREWIPVTERLPKEDGSYLVSGKWGSGKEAVGDCDFSVEDGYFQAVWNFYVLAWMPLPPAYKGEKE